MVRSRCAQGPASIVLSFKSLSREHIKLLPVQGSRRNRFRLPRPSVRSMYPPRGMTGRSGGVLGVLFLVVLVSKGKITVFIQVFQTGKLLVKVCLINRNHWHVYLCTCTVQLLRLFLINNLNLLFKMAICPMQYD